MNLGNSFDGCFTTTLRLAHSHHLTCIIMAAACNLTKVFRLLSHGFDMYFWTICLLASLRSLIELMSKVLLLLDCFRSERGVSNITLLLSECLGYLLSLFWEVCYGLVDEETFWVGFLRISLKYLFRKSEVSFGLLTGKLYFSILNVLGACSGKAIESMATWLDGVLDTHYAGISTLVFLLRRHILSFHFPCLTFWI